MIQFKYEVVEYFNNYNNVVKQGTKQECLDYIKDNYTKSRGVVVRRCCGAKIISSRTARHT